MENRELVRAIGARDLVTHGWLRACLAVYLTKQQAGGRAGHARTQSSQDTVVGTAARSWCLKPIRCESSAPTASCSFEPQLRVALEQAVAQVNGICEVEEITAGQRCAAG